MRSFPALLLACCLATITACSDDDDPVEPQPQEFVAEDADFANYDGWPETTAPMSGKDPAGLVGGAHGADDSTLTRYIHINDANASRDANGNFPIGTRLVKEVRMEDGSVAMVTAMAKRGSDFNTSYGGWEWFILDENGNIQSRDANLMDGMCNGCHAQAANEDYVFTK